MTIKAYQGLPGDRQSITEDLGPYSHSLGLKRTLAERWDAFEKRQQKHARDVNILEGKIVRAKTDAAPAFEIKLTITSGKDEIVFDRSDVLYTALRNVLADMAREVMLDDAIGGHEEMIGTLVRERAAIAQQQRREAREFEQMRRRMQAEIERATRREAEQAKVSEVERKAVVAKRPTGDAFSRTEQSLKAYREQHAAVRAADIEAQMRDLENGDG